MEESMERRGLDEGDWNHREERQTCYKMKTCFHGSNMNNSHYRLLPAYMQVMLIRQQLQYSTHAWKWPWTGPLESESIIATAQPLVYSFYKEKYWLLGTLILGYTLLKFKAWKTIFLL